MKRFSPTNWLMIYDRKRKKDLRFFLVGLRQKTHLIIDEGLVAEGRKLGAARASDNVVPYVVSCDCLAIHPRERQKLLPDGVLFLELEQPESETLDVQSHSTKQKDKPLGAWSSCALGSQGIQ
jgi:hypothetical protein